MYRSILAISLGLALTQLPKLAGDQKSGLPASAQEITSDVHTYDQVLPVCSPDGHWLAFEYHETSDPNYPRVGIMDLSQDPSPWYTLPLRILFDPRGVIERLVSASATLTFEVTDEDLDFSISKGLAAAREAFRRTQRQEMLFAQILLDELRFHMIQADD